LGKRLAISYIEYFQPAGNYLSERITKYEKGVTNMKIAVISDDGITLSQHFGRASLYVVATVEKGKVMTKETRNKMGHQHFAASSHEEHAHGPGHGFDADSQSKHDQMAQNIDDCQVIIVGGMGWGAYESMKSRGLEPVITDVSNIDEALKLYIEGKLPNLMEKLH
jgi:predicted Fe-Mo cluster-binding NifX family protein